MKRLVWSAAIATLAALLLCAVYWSAPAQPLAQPRPEESPRESASASQSLEATAAPTPRPQVDPDRPALRRLDPPPAAPRSPLADKLNAPGTDGAQDVAVVFDLFAHYRERYGGFPTGEDNAAFVNALTGNNPQRLAFLDRSHPSINPRGELVDRWGKPFFFHLQSRESLEVRSAGPDGELYTADDLVKSTPGTTNL